MSRREWLAVYTAVGMHPKYRHLSPIGRGALLHLWLLAGYQDPEATWSDVEELRDSLRLDGFPDGALDELVGLHWVDVADDGSSEVHNWDLHQLEATEAIGKAWEAAGKREWRKQKQKRDRPTEPGVLPHPLPVVEEDNNNTLHNKGPDMSRHVPTPGYDEVVGEYERLFGIATDKKRIYLSSIAARWPAERIVTGLRVEKARGATGRNICGRLEAGLKGGDS